MCIAAWGSLWSGVNLIWIIENKNSRRIKLRKKTLLYDTVVSHVFCGEESSPPFCCPYLLRFSGMLFEAVLPPSKEHSYAQWMERTNHFPMESWGPQEGSTGSVLSSVNTQQSGAVHSLPVDSFGMETPVACSVSCDKECDLCLNACQAFPCFGNSSISFGKLLFCALFLPGS